MPNNIITQQTTANRNNVLYKLNNEYQQITLISIISPKSKNQIGIYISSLISEADVKKLINSLIILYSLLDKIISIILYESIMIYITALCINIFKIIQKYI